MAVFIRDLIKLKSILDAQIRPPLYKTIMVSSVSSGFEMLSAVSLLTFVQFLIHGEIGENVWLGVILPDLTIEQLVIVTSFILSLNFVLKIFSNWYLCKAINLLRVPICLKLVRSIFARNTRQFKNKSRSYYVTMITWEVDHLLMSVITPSIIGIQAVISLLLITFALMIANLHVTILVVILYGIAFYAFYFFTKERFRRAGENRLSNNSERISKLNGIISDYKKIKVENTLSNRLQPFSVAANGMSMNIAELQFLGLISRPLIEYVSYIMIFGLAIISLKLGFGMQFYAELLGFFIVAALKTLPVLQTILTSVSTVKSSHESIKSLLNLDKIYKYTPNFPYETNITLLENEEILLNITNIKPVGTNTDLFTKNLDLERNEKLIIAGRSGVGKSTLADSIVGLAQISGTTIELNSKLIKGGEVFYLPQENYLDSAPIDVQLSQLNDDKLYLKRLKEVFFPEMEKDDYFFQRPLGDNGDALSGGQKQRVSLMLTLAQTPKLLIMDEATNSIDPKNEKIIATYLLDEFFGAVIWISHNTNTYGFRVLRLDENNDQKV